VILGGRVLLVLAAGIAVVAAIRIGRASDREAARSSARSSSPGYLCPMHPEVVGTSASACPICGMALEPRRSHPDFAGVSENTLVPPTYQGRFFFDVTIAKPRPMAREMRAPARIDASGAGTAIFYDDEVALLDPREKGVFTVAGGGDGDATTTQTFQVQLTDDPPRRQDRSTSAVRFVVTAVAPTAAARDGGWIKFPSRTRQLLAVPASAILQSSTGAYVLVASGDRHRIARRAVQIGRVLFGYATILGGVREGERVVAMNTFLLDAERRWGARADEPPQPPAGAP
jgi:Heavy metal binding domain